MRSHCRNIFSSIKKVFSRHRIEKEKRFAEAYYDYLENEPSYFDTLSEEEKKQLKERLLHKIDARIIHLEREPETITLSKKKYAYRSIAAAVLLIVVSGTALLLYRNQVSNYQASMSAAKTTGVSGINRATLTLSNGQKIDLDSFHHQLITNEGHANIYTSNGHLTYETSGESQETKFNMLTTGKGQQYGIVLSDGTKVFLDAVSSLRFPTAFNTNERVVEVTGRAWFEVSKNPQKPFSVKKGNYRIKVLGTKFNVDAYDDEPDFEVTLAEGKVQVSNGSRTDALLPGQQAILSNNSDYLSINKDVNVESIIAWKDGVFKFEKASLQEVLKQVSRWYDVDIIYKTKVPDVNFIGEFNRYQSLSDVVSFLEITGVHIQLIGKELIISG